MSPAPLDMAFLTDGRPYLTTRQAAILVGYAPSPALPSAANPQMRCFRSWAQAHGVRRQPGARVYRRADLEAALTRSAPSRDEQLAAVQRRAREDARRARGLQLVAR